MSVATLRVDEPDAGSAGNCEIGRRCRGESDEGVPPFACADSSSVQIVAEVKAEPLFVRMQKLRVCSCGGPGTVAD